MDIKKRPFKYIALIRHAHAEPPTPNGDDASRPISLKGKYKLMETADGISQMLSSIGNVTLFSSPKKRAIETSNIIASYIGIDSSSIHISDSISQGDFDAFLEFASGFDGTPVVFGHEPFLSEWCHALTGSSIKFSKGGLCILEFDESQWRWKIAAKHSPKYLSRISKCSRSCRSRAMTLGQLFNPLISEAEKLIASYPDVTEKESVHGMRVSIRKLRVALYALKPLMDSRCHSTLSKAFKDIMLETSELRESDMLKPTLKRALGKQFNQTLYDTFTNHVRSKTESRASTGIYSFMHCGHPKEALSEFTRIAEYSIKHDVMKSLKKRLSKLSSTLAELISSASDLDDDALLHKIRIKCKSLRYFLELFPFISISKPYRIYVYASLLHDTIGHYHDIQTSKAILVRNSDMLDTRTLEIATTLLESRRKNLKPEITRALELMSRHLKLTAQ